MSDPEDNGRRLVQSTPMRKAIARRMSESKQQAPHFYVSCEISMDAANAAIEALNESRAPESRITLTVLLLKAVALTLADYPEFNAHWTPEGHEIIDDINLGVAISLPAGLIAPAILDCGDFGIEEFSHRLADLAARAGKGKLRAAELNDTTFTLSNLGMFDVSSFTAIITPPQVAILAAGRAYPLPRVVDGEVAVQSIMNVTMSSDHRAVDGTGAARFLGALKERLEAPQNWL